jgi:hypothetical protein
MDRGSDPGWSKSGFGVSLYRVPEPGSFSRGSGYPQGIGPESSKNERNILTRKGGVYTVKVIILLKKSFFNTMG